MSISLKVRILNVFRRVWMIPALESSLTLWTRGLPPNHPVCKLVPNPYQYSPQTYRILNRDGIRMRLDISDYIGHYLYFGFKDDSMDKLFSLCSETSVVVDVGANIGWTALRLANTAKRGRVFGFEPDPLNFERSTENVRLCGLKNIEIFPIGLGNKQAMVNMEVRTTSNRGGNRIATKQSLSSQTIELTRLDDFASKNHIGKVSLMKIDVEGYELQVLRGAEELVRKHKPVLFIEVDDNNLRDQGDSAETLICFLGELGYTSISHAESNVDITKGMNFENCHFDIVAVE